MIQKNILVTGANGQLGSELRKISEKYKQYQFFYTDIAELDICDKSEVDNFISENKITHIINCAAYTAVDKAEKEIQVAEKVNHYAVRNLAEISKKHDIRLVHISTDYVFDGKRHVPYKEIDVVNPSGIYGKTKLDGEKAILTFAHKAIIIRTSWLYSEFGNNFVKTIKKLAHEREQLTIISDQIGTPTNAADLAMAIMQILPKLNNAEPEIYHFSNEGVCSWYDFAQAIVELKQLTCKIIPIETKDYPTPACRPNYSVLNKSKIKNEFNIEIPFWRESLKKCLKNIP